MSRYPTEQFCEPPQEEILCSICQDVFDEPTETPCRHVFCWQCISSVMLQNPNCPLCRKSFDHNSLQPVLPLFKSVISQLKMRCKYKGCKDTTPLERYLSHIENCNFNIVECPFDNCTIQCPKKDLNGHMEKCELREVDCPKQCGERMVYKNTDLHIKTKCINRNRKCSNCNESDHLADDPHDCIKHLLALISVVKQNNSKLQDEVGLLKKENEKQKCELQDEVGLLKRENQEQKRELQSLQQTLQNTISNTVEYSCQALEQMRVNSLQLQDNNCGQQSYAAKMMEQTGASELNHSIGSGFSRGGFWSRPQFQRPRRRQRRMTEVVFPGQGINHK